MVLLISTLTIVLGQAAAPMSVDDELRLAKNEYSYGDYAKAAEHLRRLLYPMRLVSDEQVIETRKYLALCYYQMDQLTDVGTEFQKLLYLDPDHELDPFSVAPPVIEMFESIRRQLQPELDVIRQRKSDSKLEAFMPRGMRRVVTTQIIERSELGTLLPFGIGQFQNGQTGWGITFAASELLLLAANVAAYVAVLSHRGYFSNDAETRQLVERLNIVQFASAGLFGLTWSVGVWHARSNFVPAVAAPPEVHDEPLTSLGTKGLGAGLAFRF